jgi:hypothetical protein
LGEKCKYDEQCSAFGRIFNCGKSSKRCEDKSRRTTIILEYDTVINESENEGYFTFGNVNAMIFITGSVAIVLLFITITTIFLIRR